MQRYLASMEGAVLSGKQCAEAISRSASGLEAVAAGNLAAV
jgi:uncharacterized protein with NAD-binding domain and iron-sulfur cluster